MEGDTIISFAALILSGVVAVIALKTFSKKTDDDRTNALENRIIDQEETIAAQAREIDELKGDIIQANRELQVCKDGRYELMMKLYDLEKGK